MTQKKLIEELSRTVGKKRGSLRALGKGWDIKSKGAVKIKFRVSEIKNFNRPITAFGYRAIVKITEVE